MSPSRISTELKVILAGAGIVFFGSLISRTLNYLLRIIVARGLGVEAYGLFILAVIFMRAFVAFSSMGIREGMIRFVSYYRGANEEARVKGTLILSFVITFLFSLVVSIILFFTSDLIAIHWFNNTELAPLLKIFTWIIPISVLTANYASLNLAYEKVKYNFWITDLSSQGLRVLTIGLAILFGFGILGVGYAYLISFFIILVLSFLVAEYKVFPLLRNKLKSKFEAKELLTYSWPLIFVGLLGYIMGWTDSFIIGNLMDIKSVGIYNAALPIANLLTMFPLIFIPLFLPLITKNYAQKETTIVKSLTKHVGKWSYFVNFPILLLMLLFPGFFINLIFGQEFLTASNALMFLSLGFFIFSLSYPSMQLLRMIKKTKLDLINLVIVIPINVVLNLLFIPHYGITGAAIATVISYLIYSTLFIAEGYYFLKLIPFSFGFWKSTLAGLVTLFLILALRSLLPINILTVILLAVIFFIIYFVLLIILKSFDEYDKKLINFLRNKILNKVDDKAFK